MANRKRPKKAKKQKKRRRDPDKPRTIITAAPRRPHNAWIRLGHGVKVNPAMMAKMAPTLQRWPQWKHDPTWTSDGPPDPVDYLFTIVHDGP